LFHEMQRRAIKHIIAFDDPGYIEKYCLGTDEILEKFMNYWT